MATRAIRIGSAVDIFAYDDGDFDSAIEVDAPIKSGTPVDPTDVLRLEDLAGRLLTPASVVNIDNPTELNSIAGVLGALILAYQAVGAAGLNEYTLYAYDSDGPAVVAPYIMDADGAGTERWIAVGGKYSIVDPHISGNITITGTVDGIDISVHAADVDAHHAQVHDVDSHSDVDLAGLANDDLMQYDDPSSKWQPKSIQEVIAGQNIAPGNVAATGRLSSGTLTTAVVGPTDNLNVAGVNTVFANTAGNNVTIGGLAGGVVGQHVDIVKASPNNILTMEHLEGGGSQDLIMHSGGDLSITAAEYGGASFKCDGTNWYDVSHAKHV